MGKVEIQMLMSEFKNAYQYTKLLINKNLDSLILVVACLIPVVNIFVLIRYLEKIVSEPSNSLKPPKLEKPNWTALIMSLLKILIVAAAWLIVAVVLIVPVGMILGAGAIGGLMGLIRFIESFSTRQLAAGVGAAVIVFVISIFAVISIVNMLKHKNVKDAFAFKDLLNNISRIGWPRYILFNITILVTAAVILCIAAQIGNNVEIGILTVSIAGILALLPASFFAKTISLMYDKNNPQTPQ
jgi:hypothetical protein